MAPKTELAHNEHADAARGRTPRTARLSRPGATGLRRLPLRRRVTVTLAVAAVAARAGGAHPLHHAAAASPAQTAAAQRAATQQAAVTAREKVTLACTGQAAWDAQAGLSVKALYADTGALSADARANNQAGVEKAGRKLASDAVAAAMLPLPPVDASAWKTLIAAYAAAGTALSGGGTTSAVPQLEVGSGALAAFSTAVAKCTAAGS
jgi:hypothetical protein